MIRVDQIRGDAGISDRGIIGRQRRYAAPYCSTYLFGLVVRPGATVAEAGPLPGVEVMVNGRLTDWSAGVVDIVLGALDLLLAMLSVAFGCAKEGAATRANAADANASEVARRVKRRIC